MKTHIIIDGVVTNTIVAAVAEAQVAYPTATCIDGDVGEIGWIWDGETLTPPHVDVDIDALVAAKLTAINNGKNAALDGGFVHDDKLFDSDSNARLAYLELSLKLSQDPTYSTPWKASTGVWVTMDAALFAALQPAYEAHIQACFAWQRQKEATINACQTIEELEQVGVSYE